MSQLFSVHIPYSSDIKMKKYSIFLNFYSFFAELITITKKFNVLVLPMASTFNSLENDIF